MRYTRPNFDREWSEAQRYSILKQLGPAKWKKIANKGSEINAKPLLRRMGNFVANKIADAEKRFKELEPDKKARVKAAFEKKEVELPIVIRNRNGSYSLMAGNTRLTSMVANGIIPKVFLIDLTKINVNEMFEQWSDKYKKSIDCSNPKGFSQKAHCQGRKKKLKEFRENLKEYMSPYGVGIGPVDTVKPMSSMGSQGQFFPNKKYRGLYATYQGPGFGTYNSMSSTNTKKEAISLNDIKSAAKRFAKDIYDKLKLKVTTARRYEYAAKVLQDVIDRKKKERAKEGLPLRHDIGYYAAAVGDTFKDIDPKKLIKMVHEELSPFKKKILQKISKPVKDYNKSKEKKEDTKRIPRKEGQPAGSDKHSDLYTDENPKGTIHGLGFTDAETAKTSVNKIEKSGKSHAHKIQAAIAMSQRAKVASERAKDPEKKKDLGAAHKIYQSFIDTNKKKD